MNNQPELPEDVLAALKANRKIEAIKLLREHHNVDLKEAKQIVDAAMASQPSPAVRRPRQTEFGFGRLVLAVMATAIAYAIYKYVS